MQKKATNPSGTDAPTHQAWFDPLVGHDANQACTLSLMVVWGGACCQQAVSMYSLAEERLGWGMLSTGCQHVLTR